MQSSPPGSARVLVSGASVTGLTLAYWLERYGFAVTVVERAPQLRPGGHALDVRGPALEVASRMGLADALRERCTKLAGISMVDAEGNEVFRSEEATVTGGRLDSADVEILRDELCQLLREAVGDRVEYVFGDTITELTQDDLGVDVTFARTGARHFEIVVGADGLHSGVRRIVFGPDALFLRAIGNVCVATFGMPNFLGLERWQIGHQPDDAHAGGLAALVMGLTKDAPARTYLGFAAPPGFDFDRRDVEAQKQLLAKRLGGAGWVIPQIVEHMQRADDFHLASLRQVRMDRWCKGRVVLCGDAGYAVSLGTGQGTTVAMVGAYVLAAELAHRRDHLPAALTAYEDALRAYVVKNQDLALEQSAKPDDAGDPMGGVPDFGALTLPFALPPYEGQP